MNTIVVKGKNKISMIMHYSHIRMPFDKVFHVQSRMITTLTARTVSGEETLTTYPLISTCCPTFRALKAVIPVEDIYCVLSLTLTVSVLLSGTRVMTNDWCPRDWIIPVIWRKGSTFVGIIVPVGTGVRLVREAWRECGYMIARA
jgi:hypothetical protein